MATDEQRTSSIVIYVVLGIWAIGMILSMIPGSGYRVEPEVHGIFMTIVGGSLVYKSQKDSGGPKDRDSDRDGGDHRR